MYVNSFIYNSKAGKTILRTDTKRQATKEQIDKLDFIQI